MQFKIDRHNDNQKCNVTLLF